MSFCATWIFWTHQPIRMAISIGSIFRKENHYNFPKCSEEFATLDNMCVRENVTEKIKINQLRPDNHLATTC